MTEDEAKTKWCPMVRYGTQGRNENGGTNKPETDGEKRGLACIGSACMMWRYERTTDTMHGYCGLAGHPQPLIVLGKS